MFHPRKFLLVFLASCAVSAATFATLGNSLPDPYGSFIPIRAGNDFLRDEFVRFHPLAELSSPCVAFFGDSRVAFNISGAIIDRSLPERCVSQNYGFPGTGLRHVEWLSREVEARIAVITVTEPMVTEPLEQPSLLYRLEGWRRDLIASALQPNLSRKIYLGLHRMSAYIQMLLGAKIRYARDWPWSSSDKRWVYSSLTDRAFVSLPTYGKEAAEMAKSYFLGNKPGRADDLAKLVSALQRRYDRVVLLIPPSERAFQQHPASIYQAGRWQIVHDVGARLHATVIDCSDASACNIAPGEFADPVHLNDKGVEAYSVALGKVLSVYMTTRDRAGIADRELQQQWKDGSASNANGSH